VSASLNPSTGVLTWTMKSVATTTGSARRIRWPASCPPTTQPTPAPATSPSA
jgi:hypothetical protein